MFQSLHPGDWLDPETKKAVAEKKLQDVSEKYGLDIADDVDLVFDSSLPYNVLGRTSMPRYSENGVTVSVGDQFFELDEKRQEKTMLHEGIHVKQFRDEIDNWLKNQFNASDEFIQEVERSSDPLYEKDIEGITEVLTDTILPFDAGTGYPYEKRSKISELESKGFDVESELADDIENEFNELVENYKEVYESFEFGELYFETGSFGGAEYTALVTGYDDGEKAVNEYLTDFEPEDDYSGLFDSEYKLSAV